MKRFSTFIVVATATCVFAVPNIFVIFNPPSNTAIIPSDNPELSGFQNPQQSASDVPSEMLLIHTQTRPLFSPSRRHWIAPTVPVKDPVTAPLTEEAVTPVEALSEPQAVVPQVTLIGVEKSPIGAKVLISKTGTQETIWLKSGEKLDNWTVQSIESASFELVNRDQKIKLELYPVDSTVVPKP